MAQIKQALGISGVRSTQSAWSKREDDPEGVQIDLLIERADQIINLCEMKYSKADFIVTKEYERQLYQKMEIFMHHVMPKQAIHLTLVTTYGLKENLHSSVFQSVITLDDLFAS